MNRARPDLDWMELSRFDLNLLIVFDAVMRERSVTRAADRLNLSQPAMSHALKRLRALMNDQLFVRTPSGMEPTPRAQQFAAPVRRALDELSVALEPDRFNPATAERSFRLSVNNYAAVVLAAPIALACAREAPGVHLSLSPSGALNIPEALDRGELDLAIVAGQPLLLRFASQRLLQDDFVAVLREDHPAAAAALTAEALAGLPRLNITSSGEDVGFVDAALAERGLVQRVGLEAPYLSAGPLLAGSDMVAVLGQPFAVAFRQSFAVAIRALPFKTPKVGVNMVWHRRFDDQSAHRWLRETIARVAAQVIARTPAAAA
ncbi:MAG: LysR family transcriptional regulator [Caulobacteraceae bacterium]|nr:LysR family transcriptional regulator [Caulobacteraceae bacterium]